ncbi:unnamed protein product [marine sediment metagenome]|uniref:Uncharacterized protein n=1 Tax=marine sediment metagenome TaxID=412755 RepID=X1CA37_9ZZZZ
MWGERKKKWQQKKEGTYTAIPASCPRCLVKDTSADKKGTFFEMQGVWLLGPLVTVHKKSKIKKNGSKIVH